MDESLLSEPVPLDAAKVAGRLNSFLPQVHLTLVSILQGVALAVLIARFDKFTPVLFPNAIAYVDSIMVIALVWFLYAWGLVTFQWPLSAWHTLLQFGIAACECFAFDSIASSSRWLLGLAATCLCGSVNRFSNTRVVSPRMFVPQSHFARNLKLERNAGIQLVLLSLALGGLALVLAGVSALQTRWISSLVVGVLVATLLADAGRTSRSDINAFLEGSPWRFENRQLLNAEKE